LGPLGERGEFNWIKFGELIWGNWELAKGPKGKGPKITQNKINKSPWDQGKNLPGNPKEKEIWGKEIPLGGDITPKNGPKIGRLKITPAD